jgi:hypothetical protein
MPLLYFQLIFQVETKEKSGDAEERIWKAMQKSF